VKLHYGKLVASVYAATTAQDGYPASNLGLESLGRPWKATGLGATDITITLPALAFIQTLFLHDVNFATATIQTSVDGVAFNALGVLTTYADSHGRRRGSIVVNTAGLKAVKITPIGGASTDGLAYWRGGAAYLFASVVTPSAAVRYGYRARTRRPRLRTELPNKLVAVATTGLNVDVIALTFERINTEFADDVIQKTLTAPCLFDLGLPNYPHQQWPVRCIEEDLEEAFNNKNISSIDIPLMEVV
jgi:hypothetical protein